ncbi:MAG: SIR2 family protein [Micrococcaceae bacterium]
MTTSSLEQRPLTFIKGESWYSGSSLSTTQRDPFDLAKNDFNEVLSSKNLTFLFGSGCSSHKVTGIDDEGLPVTEELGIPTMAPLAEGILSAENKSVADKYGLTTEVIQSLSVDLGIDLADEEYASNLERLMEVLYGFQFALVKTKNNSLIKAKVSLDAAIEGIKRYVFDVCKEGQEQPCSETVLDFYQTFYRKLSQRSRSLPRPTVATTNYDLFNEIAMDRIGIPYINGFLGSVEKRFNPSSFRYTIAQRLDMASQRWTSLDNLVYLIKLHGSLNWKSTSKGLFPVEERALSESVDGNAMLIYPTPAKQNASFAAPYSDMFREFQTRVVQEQSALVVVGYSFGDEHVNNIIYQALTIPTFRLVIFAKPESIENPDNKHIKVLQELGDPRIWVVGTDEPNSAWKAHYFKNFVTDIMPAVELDPAENAIDKVMDLLSGQKGKKDDE